MTSPTYLTPLGPSDLAAHNISAEWPFGMADQVRFSELDGLGHVNNAAYLVWFETIRIHYLRDYGITDFDGTHSSAVVKRVTADYHASLHLYDQYIVTARTVSFRNTSFAMEYAVFSPTLKVEGSAVVVLLDPNTNAKAPLREETKALLRDRDGAKQV